MTIENPPRLWAFAVRGAIHAAPEEAPLLASVHQGWGAAKPQAYVREDVAAQREASVLEGAMEGVAQSTRETFEELATALGLTIEDACDDSWITLCDRVKESVAETTALRRERDALLAERDAVAREGWRACVLGVSIIRFWQAETKSRSGDQRGALALMNEAVALRDIFTADDTAAGKGVG